MKNNGQIAGITDNVQSGRSVTYTYDSLHRLKTALTNGSGGYPQWGLSWTYDRYGNRTQQSVTHGSGPSASISVNSANQVTLIGTTSVYHDLNGNMTQDDLYKYKYDAENRLVEVRTLADALVATYAFDGHSLRVIKVVGSDRTWHIYAGTELIAEYDDAASATYSSGTNSGGAQSDSVSTLLYQHSDHLTTRLTTENNGDLSNEQAHYPYGESWYAQGDADGSVLRKFTSYMKDGETATGKLNYAVARQHSGRVGRFHMTDPVQPMRLWDPQSFNRYSYARNNVTNLVDRLGRDYCSFMTQLKPNPPERGEPAEGGPRWDGEDSGEAAPGDAQESQADCEKAGGVWVKSSCSGGACETHQGGPGAAGGGPGFGMVGYGGWIGAVTGFHNQQQAMAGYGSSGFAGFNPHGLSGTLGSYQFGSMGDFGFGSTSNIGVPSYKAGIFPTPGGGPPTYQTPDFRAWLSWWNQFPPRHSSGGRTGLPAITLDCRLVQETAGACSYSCSSDRGTRFATRTLITDVGALGTVCPASGAITSCPLSIQARETPGGAAQITSCGL